MSLQHVEGFDEAIQKMGDILFEYVASALNGKAWNCACFHERNNFSKLRITMSDGTLNADLSSPRRQGNFFVYLSKVRDMKDQFAKRWQGFKLTVFPDGKCKVQLDYDESDPNFFDS